jgi:hypothetical protein
MDGLRGISAFLLLACAGAAWGEHPAVRVPAEGWQVLTFDEISSIRTESVRGSVAIAGYSRYSRLAFVAHLPDPVPRGKASGPRRAKRAVAEAQKTLALVARELRAQAGGLPGDLSIAVVGGGFGADDYRAIVARKASELFHVSPGSILTTGGGPVTYSVGVSARGELLVEPSFTDAELPPAGSAGA